MSITPTDHRTTTPRAPRRHVSPPPQRRAAHPVRTRRESAVQVGRLAGEQLAVAAGQLGAGVGNLVFALVAARLLAPGAFAELTAFLALYLLIHVPAGSLSAGSALAPDLAARARRRALVGGAAVGGVLAALSMPLGNLLDLSPVLLLAAAAAAPTAGLLALDRGRLYGLGRRTRVVGSLLAEPAVRLSIGVALASAVGAVGGAIAVVVAGWAALAVAYLPARQTPAAAPAPAGQARPGVAVAAFLLLAVIQNQDVLFANALLDADEAGRFAVLSTLGGVAAFATTTVPLMLLPRAGRDALRAALLVAAALGLGAVAVVAISPGPLVGMIFGSRYEAIGSLAVPYVLAMALLGVARVLVAHACAGSRARRAVALLAPVVVLHAGLLLAIGDDAAGVATATLISTATLTAGAAALSVTVPRIAVSREVLIVGAIALGGLALRLIATRGIWLDEAISIHQAQLPLGDMLTNLRTTDVHPPLHHILLWSTVRLLGDGEVAVRVPSLIAATAMIPVLYAAATDLYDKRAGMAAATLAAVAPFAVWYADEARMYALFMLFALLSLWMQVRVIRGAGTGSWLGFVLSAAALVYTQYFGALFVATQMLGFAVAVVRGALPLRRVLAWTLLLALLLAPLAGFAHDQFAANEAAGKGFQQPTQTGGGTIDPQARPGAYAALTNFAWAVLGYHSDGTMTAIAALWPLGVLLALALLGRGRSWTTLLVVACGLLPAIGLFVLGQLKPFVFEVRYFIGVVPLALMLIARALTSWPRRPVVIALATTLAAVTLGLGLADQQLNGSNPRVYDFKTAVHDIEARAQPGDVIVFTPSYLDHVVSYYEHEGLKLHAMGQDLPEPRRGRKVFVLASFQDKPQFRAAARDAVKRLSRRHHLVHRESVPQITTWEFSR